MVCVWWKKPAEKSKQSATQDLHISPSLTVIATNTMIKSVKTNEELVFSFRNSIKKEVLKSLLGGR